MGNASVDAKSVRNLSVSWAAGSVDISVVDDGAGDVIELVETAPTGLTKAQQMRWSVSGGTLKVDYGSWWSCFALGQKRLEVRIPERYAQSLGAVTVDGASGYYRVAGIGCDTLRLKLASGEIDADGLAAAALDVVSTEPIRSDNPLLQAKNCILTPHISWAPIESRQRILDCTIRNVRQFLSGTPENNVWQ